MKTELRILSNDTKAGQLCYIRMLKILSEQMVQVGCCIKLTLLVISIRRKKFWN